MPVLRTQPRGETVAWRWQAHSALRTLTAAEVMLALSPALQEVGADPLLQLMRAFRSGIALMQLRM